MARKLDARQTIYRGILSQLLPNISAPELDNLLLSLDAETTPPFRLDASNPSSLIVNVQGSIVSNPESGRNHSASHIANQVISFSSGTITFPAASGGNITTSPGSSTVLTLPSGQYCKVLISIDGSGDIVATPGTPDPVEANAAVPSPITSTLPIGFITLFNSGGTIQNIVQNKIYQFASGGGGSGGNAAGYAQEVIIADATSSLVVTFPAPLANNNYVVEAQLVNTTDPDPQFQPVTITSKSASGFTAKWNSPVDSANYKLGYMVPAVQEQVGEAVLSTSATSVTVTLPIPLAGTSYIVTAQFVNITDADPQFQPVTITGKTTSDFTASWNDELDSNNYRLAYKVAEFQ